MRLSVCIATRNRSEALEQCLEALWNSTVKPFSVVVSDDSSTEENQRKTQAVVEQYPETLYLLGPKRGACANRNNALKVTPETDLVAFIDDDIFVDSNFIELALQHYQSLSPEQGDRLILSGVGRDEDGNQTGPTKLSFRGYFQPTNQPEAVDIHAAVFPISFLKQEQWDENIFIGQEDAELCLRAIKLGYRIQHCPDLTVFDSGKKATSLNETTHGELTEYDVYREACRLYVGIKRYKHLFPNPFKLVAFLLVFSVHMTLYFARRRSLQSLPMMIRYSRLSAVW